jgi:hypothetical protein
VAVLGYDLLGLWCSCLRYFLDFLRSSAILPVHLTILRTAECIVTTRGSLTRQTLAGNLLGFAFPRYRSGDFELRFQFCDLISETVDVLEQFLVFHLRYYKDMISLGFIFFVEQR